MLGFLTRLVGGALDPLIDRATALGARLFRKLALVLVAGVCLVVVLIALTIAFDLWIASRFGPIVGALAVAGVYLVVAALAIVFALRDGTQPAPVAKADAADGMSPSSRAQIDQFTEPLLAALAKLGLRREQLAVLAGSSLAKQLGPLPLVGLALLGGFLAGRMWKRWRAILSADAIVSVLDLFGFGARAAEDAANADVPDQPTAG